MAACGGLPPPAWQRLIPQILTEEPTAQRNCNFHISFLLTFCPPQRVGSCSCACTKG